MSHVSPNPGSSIWRMKPAATKPPYSGVSPPAIPHPPPCFAQSRIVDLEDEAGVDNRPVFGLQRLGDREHVLFFGGVVPVLATADHSRRDGGHAGLLHPGARQSRLEGGE